MLAHLDKNRLALKGDVKQTELYDLMLALANYSLSIKYVPARTRRRAGTMRFDAEHQVWELADWLHQRVTTVKRGERRITYRQLRQILKHHGYALDARQGNTADVVREESKRKGLLKRQPVIERKVIGRIGYHSEGEQVAIKTIKQLRRMCHLTEEQGVDTDAFYEGADIIDTFVNRYRTVLRRLAKT
jgi:death-on-curing protein